MIGIRSAISIRARGQWPLLEAVYMTAPRSVCRTTKKPLPRGGRPYMTGVGKHSASPGTHRLRLQRLQKPHRLALRRRHELALPHHAAAADEGTDGPAGDAHAVIRGPAGFGGDPFVGDGLAALQIDDGEVGVVARGDP